MNNKETEITGTQPPIDSALFDIESDIAAMEANDALCDATNFCLRAGAIDLIEHIIDKVESIPEKTAQTEKLRWIKSRAEKLKTDFEAVDLVLFRVVQSNIRIGALRGTAFSKLVKEHVNLNIADAQHPEDAGYDHLDIFINGLFPVQIIPEQTKELEPDMVYYQKTPARIIFELVEKIHFVKQDVFFDIGSGLGQAAILVNLLAGVAVKGIEAEPAFCTYANDCASSLHLKEVNFVNIDARKADYTEGTVFFMFTPFRGKILQDVLEILRKEALLRNIKIITYGP